MKLTIERDALHQALNRVAKIVERRSTIPVLGHLLLTASGSVLAIKGTDLDIEAETGIPADIATPGTATAPAHLLADLVSRYPSGAQVSFELDETRLIVKSGRARATLNALAPEDFPETGAFEPAQSFEIGAEVLSGMIAMTEFAISTEETRYYLNGIYMHATVIDGAPVLRAVATDGHRMSLNERVAPDGAEGLAGMIVPRKSVAEIQRQLKAAIGKVTVAANPARLRLIIPGKSETTTLTTKLIDGTFPDYERVIPRANSNKAKLDREALLAAINRVACVGGAKTKSCKFSFGDGKLIVSMIDLDNGSSSDEVEADYEAAPLDIGFNAAYVTDVLNTLSGDTVTIALDSPGSPALVQSTNDSSTLITIMPLRI